MELIIGFVYFLIVFPIAQWLKKKNPSWDLTAVTMALLAGGIVLIATIRQGI